MEYVAAGGTAKRCTLLSSLTVKCPDGEQEVDGQCRAVTRSACESASADVVATEDAARGAGSLIKAALRLADGVGASLVATPLQSAVEVPVSQSGTIRGGIGTWEGSVSLPSTGAWALQLTIGQERCSETVLNITCTAGFLDDGGGRCLCPVGFENKGGKCVPVKQEVDACQLASVSTSTNATIAAQTGDVIAIRPGTRLGVSFAVAATAAGFEVLLVPLQGTETKPSTEMMLLGRSGTFALKLRQANSTKECSLIPRLEVKCDDTEQEVDGQCQPRELCRASDGFWEDSSASGGIKCRKRPQLAAKAASDGLVVVLAKSAAMSNLSSAVEIRLVSGDVDAASIVQWTASSSSPWVVLEQLSGTLSSASPVVTIILVVAGSGRNDTAISGPLRSWIRVSSTMRNRSDLFELNTSRLEMPVEVTIEAAVRPTSADVRVEDQDGNDVVDGGEVVTGGTLTLTLSAFDFERLPICRTTLQVAAELSQLSGRSNKSLPMQHQYDNSYRLTVPSSWIGDPGSYTLWIHGGAVTIHFAAVATSKKQIYLVAGLSGVAVVLLGIFVVLVYRGQGSWKTRVQKVAMPLFGIGAVSLEVWDVYGDYFSYRSFLERRAIAATVWMEQLMIPYTLCSGLAGLVSLVSIGLKLRIFVGFVARMLGRVQAVLDHEQELADLKQQMAALSLVALFENLPMGKPSLICRHALLGPTVGCACRRPRGILLPQLRAGVPRQEPCL
jgi:hypothetical protein